MTKTLQNLFAATNLHVSVGGAEVVRGIDLRIGPGEVHAIMGPNGSGKSSLVNALMGHPSYEITQGSVQWRGQDLLAMQPHERSQAGLFLAFQYPKEIAGVSLRSFLFAAYKAHPGFAHLSVLQFQELLARHMQQLNMDPAFAERSLNQGFSGGEKKKAEILQLLLLQPQLALLDETDSGLDVDALKIVADGVNAMRAQHTEFSALIVTHYARILDHITPDHVHVMVKGTIRESGGPQLAKRLEREGYAKYLDPTERASIRLEID
jgi:Fe-S cluster assembly ATP-binding protein